MTSRRHLLYRAARRSGWTWWYQHPRQVSCLLPHPPYILSISQFESEFCVFLDAISASRKAKICCFQIAGKTIGFLRKVEKWSEKWSEKRSEKWSENLHFFLHQIHQIPPDRWPQNTTRSHQIPPDPTRSTRSVVALLPKHGSSLLCGMSRSYLGTRPAVPALHFIMDRAVRHW